MAGYSGDQGESTHCQEQNHDRADQGSRRAFGPMASTGGDGQEQPEDESNPPCGDDAPAERQESW